MIISGFDATGVADGSALLFSGRDAQNDGGGGLFTYCASSVQPADNILVFAPLGGGRLFRNGWSVFGFNGPISPIWAGVKGDNAADDTAAWSATIAAAFALKATISAPGGLVTRITSSLDMPPTLRIVGEGAAGQCAPKFVAVGGINIFTAREGAGSESACFENLAFDSATPGTGAAFYATNTSYVSQTTFKNCTFYSNLRYGINAPVILCSFYDCDFGSYPGAQQNFTAINAIGTAGTYEPNVNTFFKCTFRKSSAPQTIKIDGSGVQWQFYGSDFEQNTCSAAVIINNGAGALSFMGGYVEANATPYFVRNYGNTMTAFCQVVKLHGVNLNSPATVAVLKREIGYPMFDIQGCYGQLNCNVTQNEAGLFNQAADLENCSGNHFNAGTGSYGELAVISTTTGYNSRRYKTKCITADTGTIANLTAAQVNSVQKLAVPVTAPNSVIATLSNPLGGFNYGGIVTVTAMAWTALTAGGAVNTATYQLLVNQGGIAACTLISSGGVTGGAAANQPSFTWTMNAANQLLATPIGSASGTFSFLIATTGMVKAV